MYLKTKIILILILAVIVYLIFLKPVDISYKVRETDRIVSQALSRFKIGPADILKETYEAKKNRKYRFEAITRTYVVSDDFPFDKFRNELKKELGRRKIEVLAWEKSPKERVSRLVLGFKNNKIYFLFFRTIKRVSEKKEPVFRKAKVAIVIDDFGYNLNNVDSWLRFEKPITFSILPNLSYSTRIASLANSYGKEIILHLPLEPQHEDAEPQEPFTVTTKMPPKEILRILERSIKDVPYLKGVSNHQGSRATEDAGLMEIVFREIKKRNLFFLDSLVTPNSVCQDLASQMDLRFAQRDIFLDNTNGVEYIKNQLNKLAEVAQAKGFAVGIGHDRNRTLEALQAHYRSLESRGIEFVYLSELVR